jgi:pyruvate carboxylase subunit B
MPEEVMVETLDNLVIAETPKKASTQTGSSKRPKPSAAGDLCTSMPGTIIKLLIQNGDKVSAGQPLLIIEAMKMETELKAPIAGRISQVLVETGEAVNPNEVLLRIE